jgi:hypothetical protein
MTKSSKQGKEPSDDKERKKSGRMSDKIALKRQKSSKK